MAFSVQMPALGESVSEGTVTRWLKKEGDTVEVDEPLLEVSTDTVDTEIPSPAAGTLSKIVAGEDETVEIGGELAVIDDGSGGSDDADDDSADEAEPQQADDADEAEEPAAEPAPAKKSSGGSGGGKGTDVTMPELGESVTEGTITRWLKSVGDTVEVDEPLLEVSTDKVDTEIPSPVAGTLQQIVAEEDETVEVGATLAVIGDGSGGSDDDSADEDSAAEAEPQQADEPAEEPAEEPAPAKKSSGGSG
ncbi:biotin/lipoyl-containing protein, partial [Dietzia sp. CH92]|uniref:biotin/lipoyl-containing protein n=1 Tax=Dietzia sp. CH92 TaxID=3051823 RepID=UPI0028D4EA02